MSEAQVTCITKANPTSSHEGITHLGGPGWRWTREQVIASIEAGSNTFYTLVNGTGVAASTISSEGPKDDPIIVYGGGPRAHIYCVYSEDAVGGDGVEEDAFTRSPTAGDWKLSLPVPPEDLDWTQKKLKSISARVTARALGDKLDDEEPTKARASVQVDVREFLKS